MRLNPAEPPPVDPEVKQEMSTEIRRLLEDVHTELWAHDEVPWVKPVRQHVFRAMALLKLPPAAPDDRLQVVIGEGWKLTLARQHGGAQMDPKRVAAAIAALSRVLLRE
jgi:hypothetical protein